MVTKNWFGKGKFGSLRIKRVRRSNYGGGWGGGGVCYRDSTVIFVIAYLSLFGILICLTAKKQLCLVHIFSR